MKISIAHIRLIRNHRCSFVPWKKRFSGLDAMLATLLLTIPNHSDGAICRNMCRPSGRIRYISDQMMIRDMMREPYRCTSKIRLLPVPIFFAQKKPDIIKKNGTAQRDP